MPNTPFDLDAVEAEVSSRPFTFTLKGATYSLPPLTAIDYKVLLDGEYDADGSPSIREMRRLLEVGLADQWDEFSQHPLSLTGLTAIFREWDAASAVSLGESAASTDS